MGQIIEEVLHSMIPITLVGITSLLMIIVLAPLFWCGKKLRDKVFERWPNIMENNYIGTAIILSAGVAVFMVVLILAVPLTCLWALVLSH